ncbi:cytochrome d ubiquinol oxidase subunit II [Halorhodospira abdelmalekii]|uniref:cytochrome d ubiquinol oxidase subunit II n=1 Tax=Halorhodospira abdelmalekii TaxID=421629 RepID=UPI0019035560|nr:cytochrome d ubiquinol oxidase subunit II [Halorhodospira abdelmalekii]MBK1734216.1 cytochrome d ubiquinol oxidase subunit II [Halorhodospira abdelmalekii]
MELIDITAIWVGLVGLAVIMYVVLDGFDLGVGILYPFMPDERARDDVMRSVAPVWDGNETWLVLGGAGLLAAFPAMYSILLPALYLGVFLLLAGLIFRGVAFEFRFKSRRSRPWWNAAFAGGSIVAAAAQGIVIGAFVQGIEVEGMVYVGGAFDWLTPFTLFTALSLVLGYALLGATWGIMKTEGTTQQWLYRVTPLLVVAVALCLLVVSLWTPLTQPQVMERWLSEWPRLLPLPLLGALALLLLWWAVQERREYLPFFAAIGLFLSAFAGIVASKWPYAIPPHVTFDEAASAPESQLFILLGILFMLPIIIGYTTWTYWVFRGKVRPSTGYS